MPVMIFSKKFFELNNNRVFHRIMETLRNRVDIRLATNSKDYQTLVRKPIFVSQKISNKSLTAILKIKKLLTLNKPGYVRTTILDLETLI